jgi:hypothetical protein
MTGPSLQCNSDHQPSRNVGAPVRENRYPRARRNGPERAEQPGLLRVGPTQSRHHGSNVDAMAGGEGIVWLSRLLDALPLITHDHPVWTGAIHRLLDEFRRDHRRRDGGGHVIGQSALPQTAPS